MQYFIWNLSKHKPGLGLSIVMGILILLSQPIWANESGQLLFSDSSAPANDTTERSLYFDAAYNPITSQTAIAYFDATKAIAELTYGVASGSGFSPEKVDSKDPSRLTFYSPHLVFDAAGTAHIFVNTDNATIMHYAKQGASWSKERAFKLDVNDHPNTDAILEEVKLGTDGSFHLLLTSGFNFTFGEPRVFYINNQTGSFPSAPETVESLSDYGRNLSMAVDNKNKAHIVYSTRTLTRYLSNSSGNWQGEDIFRDDNIDYWPADFPNIAIDSSGTPNIVATEQQNGGTGSAVSAKLRYLRRASPGKWESFSISETADGYIGSDGNRFTGANAKLYIDNDGHPHILFSDIASYHDAAGRSILKSGQIRHAWHDGKQLQIKTIFSQTPNSNELHRIVPSTINGSQFDLVALEVIRQGDIYNGFASQNFQLKFFSIASETNPSTTAPTTPTNPTPTATPTPNPGDGQNGNGTPTTDTSLKPSIRINNKTHAQIKAGESASISLGLDASKSKTNEPRDWWLAADTPKGYYSYEYPSGWVPGLTPALTASPISLIPFSLPVPADFGAGNYVFYFALDDNADGKPDATYLAQAKLDIFASGQLPPSQATIVQAYASSNSAIFLRWLASEHSGDVSYQIHASEQQGYSPNAATLKSTVKNTTELELSNLTPGSTYYVSVLAVTEDGKQGLPSPQWTIGLPVENFQIRSNVVLKTLNQSSHGLPTINNSQMRFESWQDEQLPGVGNIIIGPTANNGYLKEVKSINKNGESADVTAESVALDRVFSKANISTTQKLFDVGAAAKRTQSNNSKRLRSRSNNNHWQLDWPDQGLSASETINNPSRVRRLNNGAYQFGNLDTDNKRAATARGDSQFNYEVNIDFQPSIKSEIDWSGVSITKGELVMTGELSLDALASYHFSRELEYEDSYELFSREYKSVYVVGGVPVYQKIEMSIEAQVSASSQTTINAKANAHVSTSLSMGAKYNTKSGTWEPIVEQGFEQAFEFKFDEQGSVNGEIRLVPKVKVTLYDFVSSTLSIEPYLSSYVRASVVNGVQNVDVNLGLECFVRADMHAYFYDIEVLPTTKICGPEFEDGDYGIEVAEIPVFSIPELRFVPLDISLSTFQQKPLEIVILAKDGANNPISLTPFTVGAGASWEIVSDVKSDGERYITTKFTPSCLVEGRVPIGLSGQGRLGTITKLVLDTTVSVNKDSQACPD